MNNVLKIKPEIIILTCKCGSHEWAIQIAEKHDSLKDDILKFECHGCKRTFDQYGEPINAKIVEI